METPVMELPRGARVLNGLMAAVAITFTVFIVLNPEPAFTAALRGLRVWWDIVFPALLPFFVGSEILMGLGVVHFMGVLLEPLMRPFFNVPGAGSFVLAMGLASGYPIGAMLTARLRDQELCTPVEGERLMAFTNTADPLFMTGAVAVGMFGRVDIAAVILAAHYLSALSVGLVMRFHGARSGQRTETAKRNGSVPARAWYALQEARVRDGRAFGKLMGDAIRNAVNTLLLIGGFIILFSVFVETLTVIGLVPALAGLVRQGLSGTGINPEVAEALIGGTFEITIGTQVASQAQADLMSRVAAASAVIAWSGLSVHAQVAAMVQGRGMSVRPYVLARVLHGTLAAVYTLALWRPLLVLAAGWAVPVTWQAPLASGGPSTWAARLTIWSCAFGGLIVALFMLFGFALVLRGVFFAFIGPSPSTGPKAKPTRRQRL